MLLLFLMVAPILDLSIGLANMKTWQDTTN